MLEEYLCLFADLNLSLGAIENLVYTAIFTRYNHLTINKEVHSDGYFSCTSKELYELTGISEKRQARIVQILVERKLIEARLKGAPPKRCIKLNVDTKIIDELLKKGRQMREAI